MARLAGIIALAFAGGEATGAAPAGGTRTASVVAVPPPLQPLRAIAYNALPCTEAACGSGGLPSRDMMQAGYSKQWGAPGRDDLGSMAKLGGNAARLYHSLGEETPGDRGDFLDHAQAVGVNVIPGYGADRVAGGLCPEFDCFAAWKAATLRGFEGGMQRGAGWHPAVAMLVLMEEPDFVENAAECRPRGAWCRVRAVLSALDGVLAAEREAGVAPGRVRLTATWSFAVRTSIDGNLTGPGIFGFRDMAAGVSNPELARYTPRTEPTALQQAFQTRWAHGLNTQARWSFVHDLVSKSYAQFLPAPWFIGQYGADGQEFDEIRADLESMQQKASRPGSEFLGTTVFQFQTAYEVPGSRKSFGLFGLGEAVIAQTGEVRDGLSPGRAWPVRCLTTELPWLAGTRSQRAKAVAMAWRGSLEDLPGLCSHRAAPPLRPLRGIAYGALPCTTTDCSINGRPSEDMLQEGFAMQWGPEGRNDLGAMANLGANAVRTYHAFGLEVQRNHSGFLDHAHAVGLNVMPGYHTDSAVEADECPGFDCYATWKKATLEGFQYGFQRGSQWHPAVSALILLNEPDFFDNFAKCTPSGPWCHVKAALSALDGVLAAEKEAKVEPGRVRLTVTWSFGMKTSIDGKVTGPGVFGFQDMVAATANPALANYTPRLPLAEIQHAFRKRWIHGLNTAAPWDFVDKMISDSYASFSPIPWFIGEYGGNGQPAAVIQQDLESMDRKAKAGGDFLGAAFFQFQTAYSKGGAEINFGLFSLGDRQIGRTGKICDKIYTECRSFPVYCLSTSLPWLPGTIADRAQAVARAWGGAAEGAQGLCGVRRLAGGAAAAAATGAAARAGPARLLRLAGTAPEAAEMGARREGPWWQAASLRRWGPLPLGGAVGLLVAGWAAAAAAPWMRRGSATAGAAVPP